MLAYARSLFIENENYAFYCVFKRRNPGIYDSWEKVCAKISEFPNSLHKGFHTRDAASIAFAQFMTEKNREKICIQSENSLREELERIKREIDELRELNTQMSVEIECLDVELDYERSKKANEMEFQVTGNPYVRRNFEKLPAEIQFQILEREEEVGFLLYIQVCQYYMDNITGIPGVIVTAYSFERNNQIGILPHIRGHYAPHTFSAVGLARRSELQSLFSG